MSIEVIEVRLSEVVVVDDGDTTVEVQESAVVETVEVGLTGPQGPKGADGSEDAVYTAASALSGHMAIAIDTAGQAIYADASQLAHGLATVGVSLNASAGGADVAVRSRGPITHTGWAFTAGQPVFVGLGGALVQSIAGGSVFSKAIAVAVSPTTIVVGLQPAIVLT